MKTLPFSDIKEIITRNMSNANSLDEVLSSIVLENYQEGLDSAIKELEKIKKEINSEDVNCRYDEFAYSSGLQKAIEIIDNHIEELKGENNDTFYRKNKNK